MHYNYHRTYNPGTGAYTSVDPLGLAGGSFSTYQYANANPISFIDPDGRKPVPCGDAICDDGMGNQGARGICATAECAAGILPSAPLRLPRINGTVSANIQFGRIGPVPVGISLACSVSDGQISSFFAGVGIVAGIGASYTQRYGAALSSNSGDPGGWGVRSNISVPIVQGIFGFGASSFASSIGTATQYGAQTVGGSPSGSFTYGYYSQ